MKILVAAAIFFIISSCKHSPERCQGRFEVGDTVQLKTNGCMMKITNVNEHKKYGCFIDTKAIDVPECDGYFHITAVRKVKLIEIKE